MSSARLLLAKFIPDLRRMEPRNIGVVLWADGSIRARFVGENGDGPRPLRRIGVKDRDLYFEWITHWRTQMAQPVMISKNGEHVSRSSPEFLDLLRDSSKLQFMLVEAGFLRGQLSGGELEEAATELYETLVLEESDREDAGHGEAEHLRRGIHEIFNELGLPKQPDFRRDYQGTFLVRNAQRSLTFDFAIKDHFTPNPPKALMQRVLLSRQASVTSAAFMFDHIVQENPIPRDRCAALVYATKDARRRSEIRQAIELVESYAVVVNVFDRSRATEQISALTA